MKHALCLFAVSVLWFGLADAKNYDPWYYQNDRDYQFVVPDKAQHFYGSMLLADRVGPVLAMIAGVVWEVGEASLGDFISLRDLGADLAGIVASRASGRLWLGWDTVDKTIILHYSVAI